ARIALARAAAALHGSPGSTLPVIGLTGTNGKTTTAWMLESIARAAAQSAGIIGTTGHRIAGRTIPSTHTTPEATVLQALLASAREAGCDLVAMEVSSIGLDLRRVDAIPFRVAAFTSFSQDHLDHHGTMAAYLGAKLRLFTELLAPGGTAVLHDGLPAEVLGLELPGRTKLLVGRSESADLRLLEAVHGLDGAFARFTWQGAEHSLRMPLVGGHNLENALMAMACALAIGVPLEAALAGLWRLPPVPGRLEPVPGARGFHAFVDYAHTPDALERVLATLRPLTTGRLTVVFGCGGDRDRSKRPLMGIAAERGADRVVLTSDNPRSEDPTLLLRQIQTGMDGPALVEPDRERAIREALMAARPGDVVLIAGKGHEATQTIGDRTLEFHDPTVAARILAEQEAP
ncbi:MAG: UDP-N-acetylmuramoyl-L-alanyl-D-glutamate--2,6-diaminopimelate ligase, partial [Myxococcota bacterium]|nr:UDP-N-acetylmuramoyl-L-alanyl-D-glutamate--2,6-diaminopimelate ligase [Myxococcota bacterium]